MTNDPAIPRKSPAGRRTILSEEIERTIVEAIRAGASQWVAANVAGIGTRTFNRWLARGREADAWEPPAGSHEFVGEERKCAECGRTMRARAHGVVRPDELYWRFWQRVRRASAEARMARETEVATQAPLRWLLNGPGRDRGDPEEPGWTSSTSVSVRRELSDQDRQALAAEVVADLAAMYDDLTEEEYAAVAARAIEQASGAVRRDETDEASEA